LGQEVFVAYNNYIKPWDTFKKVFENRNRQNINKFLKRKKSIYCIQRLERLEATLDGLPVQPIETRIHILERNFLASVKRKTKLNATLTGLQSEVRGSLVSLYRSLLDLSTNVEASRQSEGEGASI
jgi:hypothetical protein